MQDKFYFTSLSLILLAICCFSFASYENDAFALGKKAKSISYSCLSEEPFDSPMIGDQVFPDSFGSGYGTVVGIKSEKALFVIKGSNDGKTYHYGIKDIALKKGKLSEVSVGDQVIPDSFGSGYGTVVGVNFQKGLFVIRGSNDGRYYHLGIADIALRKGTLSNLSVGDRVIPDSFVSGYGTVVGINFQKNLFVICGSNDGEYYRYSYDYLFRTSERGNHRIQPKVELPLSSRGPTEGGQIKGSSVQEDGSCIICQGGKKEYALVPCGHLVYCSDCEPKNKTPIECPICRSTVEKVIKIYR